MQIKLPKACSRLQNILYYRFHHRIELGFTLASLVQFSVTLPHSFSIQRRTHFQFSVALSFNLASHSVSIQCRTKFQFSVHWISSVTMTISIQRRTKFQFSVTLCFNCTVFQFSVRLNLNLVSHWISIQCRTEFQFSLTLSFNLVSH